MYHLTQGPWKSWWLVLSRSPRKPLGELSILALVQNHTLDLQLAALLWAIAARRGPVIVASPPQGAGKTTLLNAMLDLQPYSTHFVETRGQAEDFSFRFHTDSARTTIMVSEFSDHLPSYLWGEGVAKVFQAVADGYSMGGTMHAASAQQVLWELASPPNNVAPAHLCLLHAIATIFVGRSPSGMVRRVESVTLIKPQPASGGPQLHLVAQWDQQQDSFRLDTSPVGIARVERRLELAPGQWEPELARRAAALRGLLDSGIVDPTQVRRGLRRAAALD